MRCREAAAHAGALIDGEADLATHARLRLHLAACAPCRRFVAQLRAARDLLRGTDPPGLDPAREEAIVAALRAAEPPPGEG